MLYILWKLKFDDYKIVGVVKIMVQSRLCYQIKKLMDNYDWNGNNPSRWKILLMLYVFLIIFFGKNIKIIKTNE